MELDVDYVKTISDRLKIYKVSDDVHKNGCGYVFLIGTDENTTYGYFFVEGSLKGISDVTCNGTMQKCLENIVCLYERAYNEYCEVVFNGSRQICEDCDILVNVKDLFK